MRRRALQTTTPPMRSTTPSLGAVKRKVMTRDLPVTKRAPATRRMVTVRRRAWWWWRVLMRRKKKLWRTSERGWRLWKKLWRVDMRKKKKRRRKWRLKWKKNIWRVIAKEQTRK